MIIPVFGFSVGHEMAGLVWTQVLVVAAFTLPVAALSSIVRGYAPLLLAMLLLFAGALSALISAAWLHSSSVWMELEWVKVYYALAVTSAAAMTIILWQYARRKTAATRMVAGIAAVLVLAGLSLFPWTSAFALQMRLSRQKVDPSSIHIGLDLGRKWL
ncbi:MAG TPA: hypothetical protein VK604_01960 [Bryobacteraceae bacterium]|nr:hypothetical protein [Bryobacteraceae bacterium]